MALPSELTRRIVEYLSPSDLARVAQINTSWRKVVYSNACWNPNKLWDIKSGDSRHEFYSGLEIPSNARHLGQPTELCFHDWLSLIRKNKYHTSIPFCILESENHLKYIKYYKRLWISLGCPCIHTNHYKWYDVYKGRVYLHKLSPADQQRIFYKHCKFIIERDVLDTNPYRFWLQKHIENSIGYTYARFDMSDIQPRSEHPADIIEAKIKTREYKRLQYLSDCRQLIIQKFHTSIQNLRIYGKKEFEKKDLPWNELFSESTKEEAVGDDASNC
jgi:hypothetical protein